jgi:uncharacterized protein YsxB (DUF464 family)
MNNNQDESTSNNHKKTEESQNKTTSNKKFSKWFFRTIIGLIIIFGILNIIAINNLNNIKPTKPKPLIAQKELEKLQQIAPGLFTLLKDLPKKYKEKIRESINKNIDKAFKPLYTHIDDFSNFHYSVTGEYTELFMLLTKNIQKFLTEKIFKPANFNENLNKALKNINSDVKNILKEYYSNIKENIKKQLNINDKQTNFIISHILTLSENDMLKRFDNNLYNTLKGIGLGSGGAATVIIIKKLIAKNISKAIAKKIAAKTTLKAGSKIAGVAAGAATGAESGLLCGPGAVLCSGIGGVIGGIIGYFAADKVIIEIDKFLNEDKFKSQIKKFIDSQKEKTKLILYNVYFQSFKKLNLKNKEIVKKRIEELKHKKIKEIIIQ